MNQGQRKMASLLSFLLNELERPVSIYDENFGLGLWYDLLFPNASEPGRIGSYRPWRHQGSRRSGVSNLQSAKDGFKVNLDVQQFRPEEICVKTVDKFVVVEGKHEERQDEHGFVSRQFTRRYPIPEDVDPEQIASSLSSDGVLTVSAPKKVVNPPVSERVIPIFQTQQPAVKDSPKDLAQGQGDIKQETLEQ